MKKTTLFAFLLLIALNLCTKQTVAFAADDETEPPLSSDDCLTLCTQIRDLCAEDVANGNTVGRDLENGILEESSCLLMCGADWTQDTADCIDDADSCAQIFDESPYCAETGDTGETIEPAEAGVGCEKACRNYAKCAGYGDDATAEDKEAAYQSCLQVCPSWTPTTQQCIASTSIHSPADCAAQSMCMFGSFQNMIPQNMPGR
ncbi:hypothetical protein JWJ90_09435 [Desulfobulbus rhabdoformis]|uniref:hypothetical protein n=1 Tax=Desulfobulbus rhabdoformis TaxID=34032 RepID=UPI001963F9CE|nr:hypothetical protein [Desulfobulbus rhabdoformis]MBM9614512.1 hypothetical protein [Desulfobulbus rhabdoformis]